MKTITIPAHIDTVISGTRVTADFSSFVGSVLLHDPRWNADVRVIRRAIKLSLSLDGKGPGDAWVVDDVDHELLTACALEPHGGYKPILGRAIVQCGYVDAIEAAADGDARAKANGASATAAQA